MSDPVFSILSLSIGVLVLVFVAYINWYGNVKHNTVQWIGKKISKPLLGSESFADGMFMYVTVMLLVVGIFLVGVNF